MNTRAPCVRLCTLRFIPPPPPSATSLNPLPAISQTLSSPGWYCFCTKISWAAMDLHWRALSRRVLRWPFSSSTGVCPQASLRASSTSLHFTQRFGLSKNTGSQITAQNRDAPVYLKLMSELNLFCWLCIMGQRKEVERENARFRERWYSKLFV